MKVETWMDEVRVLEAKETKFAIGLSTDGVKKREIKDNSYLCILSAPSKSTNFLV